MFYFLIGPPGVGKSTVCGLLQHKYSKFTINLDYLGFRFHQKINFVEGEDLTSIFNRVGSESFFSDAVFFLQVLKEMSPVTNFIVDVGAGFWGTSFANSLLNDSICLKLVASPEVTYARYCSRPGYIEETYEKYLDGFEYINSLNFHNIVVEIPSFSSAEDVAESIHKYIDSVSN